MTDELKSLTKEHGCAELPNKAMRKGALNCVCNIFIGNRNPDNFLSHFAPSGQLYMETYCRLLSIVWKNAARPACKSYRAVGRFESRPDLRQQG